MCYPLKSCFCGRRITPRCLPELNSSHITDLGCPVIRVRSPPALAEPAGSRLCRLAFARISSPRSSTGSSYSRAVELARMSSSGTSPASVRQRIVASRSAEVRDADRLALFALASTALKTVTSSFSLDSPVAGTIVEKLPPKLLIQLDTVSCHSTTISLLPPSHPRADTRRTTRHRSTRPHSLLSRHSRRSTSSRIYSSASSLLCFSRRVSRSRRSACSLASSLPAGQP